MKKNRQVISQITIILIFIVGILTMLYPFYVDALNNVIDQVRVDRYLKESQKEFEAERKRLAEENSKLSESGLAPGADPVANPNGGTVSAAYYKKHLIGTINIPDLAIELPLFDTTNDDLLEQGATVLDGTSFPVGGASTHAVISAHRGLPERELFTNLPELKNGDIFLLNVLGETLAYEVFNSQVVTPDRTSVLKIESGQDLVTLMTCTPYMINSHRLLVTGKRVPYTPAAEKKQVKGDRFRKLKQIAILAGTALLILAAIYQLYHVIARYRLRKVRFDFTVCL
ncbi:MAG: class C sortase, partial [Tetragenococcus halophilus]|nr:class C sortase [Tetragenococcus halophilus]